MKREEIKAIFPEAADEQIDKIISVLGIGLISET